MRRLLVLLMLSAACGAQVRPTSASHQLADTALQQDSTFTKREGNGTDEARLIPDALVQGQALGAPLAGVAAAEACSVACRQHSQCRWFAYCEQPAGCQAANSTQRMAYQDCQLLDANCSQHITIAAADGVTSGFPVRLEGVMQISGFVQFPAQGIRGGDLECPESLEAGTCSFRSPLAAASTCIRTPECRAMVVYPNGTDGCGTEPVAMLKSAGLNPADAFVSDRVYTLQVTKYQADESTFWLTADEGTVVLPNDTELAAGDAALAAPGAWKGCLWGAHALYEGEVVGVLDGVASPEDCCRACHASTINCTVWNWCDPTAATNGTCFYEAAALTREAVTLQALQCQLRHQQLAVPEIGSPPVLLAKGPQVPFTGGAPMSVWAAEQPGFQRHVGRSTFASGRYACEGSLRPQAGECVLREPADQLARECAANETCVAFLLKPGGIFNGTPQLGEVGYLKSDADPAKWILNPTTILFTEDGSSSSSSGSSSGGGTSAGVIAGAVVGAVAVVAVAAAAAWVVLRRRRAAAAGAAQADEAGKSLGGGSARTEPFGSSTHESFGSKQPWAVQLSHSGPPSSPFASPFGAAAAAAAPGGYSHGGSSTSSAAHHQPTTPTGAVRQGSAAVRLGSGPLRHGSGPLPPHRAGSLGQPGVGLPLPSAMLSGGVSAVLPVGSGAPSGALSGTLSGTHVGSSANDAQALEELMDHVAAQDAAQLASAGLQSSGSSEPGQWMVEHLPPRLREWLIDPSLIEYLRWPNGKLIELGQGASAHVYKAVYNGEVVACKEMDLEQSAAMQEAFITEATRLQALRHPNIIGFYGVSIAQGKGVVVMEFAEGRDLHSALQVHAAGSTQRLFCWQRRGRRVAFEIAKAINYLHSKDVIHFDIKSQNVLLTANGAVRLADVGFSRLKDKTFLSHVPLIGTFAWIAPEVLLGKAQVDQSADTYSFGVVMWEIVTGERPQRGSLRMPKVPEECPQDVCDLILQCLEEEPSKRPTAPQLLKTLGQMLERPKGAAAASRPSTEAGRPASGQQLPGLPRPASPRS